MKIHPAAWSLFLLLATGIVAAAYVGFQPRASSAPNLRVPTTNNETFALSDQRGQIVVLDFFQIWCESCAIVEKEIHSRIDAWNQSGVRVVSVGVAPANTLDDLRTYQAEHNLTWTVASDTDRAVEKFSVIGLPTVAVVDGAGHLVFHRSGPVTASQLDAVIAQTQAQARAPVAVAKYSLWGLAAVAGIASFFSPCAIGLLPGYVAHAVRFSGPTGQRAPLRRAAAWGALAATGLLLVFLGLGGLAYAFGQAAGPFLRALGPFVGALFILVGVLLLVRPYSLVLQRVFSPLTQLSGSTAPSAQGGGASYFLYGIGYGAGAAGCTAPVLLNLVALAWTAGPTMGLALIVVYGGTAALLMTVLTVVVAGGRTAVAPWIQRHAHHVEVASALFFVGAGAFLLWFAWRAGTLTF